MPSKSTDYAEKTKSTRLSVEWKENNEEVEKFWK
jgi:hypothetical protein